MLSHLTRSYVFLERSANQWAHNEEAISVHINATFIFDTMDPIKLHTGDFTLNVGRLRDIQIKFRRNYSLYEN
jgi:hypothetical protein